MPADSELFEKVEAVCGRCGLRHEVLVYRDRSYSVRNRRCPTCEAEHEAEREAEKHAEAERERTAALEATWNAICPPLYQKTDPKRLPAERLAEVMDWQYGPVGILAVGPTRRGKTRSLYLLLHRLLQEGREVVAFDCAAFGHECGMRFMDGSGASWADGLAEVEVCFFDDFGKIPMTERVESELLALVERRTANELPILATTNMTGQDLERQASADRGAPLVARLREFCRVIVF